MPMKKSLGEWKKVFNEVLEALENTIGSPVVIAGGAVRDAYLRKNVKDIDCWVSCSQVKSDVVLQTFANAKKLGDNQQYGDNKIVYELDFFMPDNEKIKINLINLINIILPENKIDFAESVMEDFDINLCKMCYLDGELYFTHKAKADIINRTITIEKPILNDHLDRVVAKYPNHEIIWNIPDINPDWVLSKKRRVSYEDEIL